MHGWCKIGKVRYCIFIERDWYMLESFEANEMIEYKDGDTKFQNSDKMMENKLF